MVVIRTWKKNVSIFQIYMLVVCPHTSIALRIACWDMIQVALFAKPEKQKDFLNVSRKVQEAAGRYAQLLNLPM